MTTYSTYAKQLEESMRKFRFDLDILKVKASEDEEKPRKLEEEIFCLQEKLDAFEKRLGDLNHATSQFWPKLKSLVDRAFEDVQDSIKAAKENYLQ